MSYTVKYEGTKKERNLAAFKDAMDWLSLRQLAALHELATDLAQSDLRLPQRYRSLLLALSFAGVQGLPARVLAFFSIYGRLPNHKGT